MRVSGRTFARSTEGTDEFRGAACVFLDVAFDVAPKLESNLGGAVCVFLDVPFRVPPKLHTNLGVHFACFWTYLFAFHRRYRRIWGCILRVSGRSF